MRNKRNILLIAALAVGLIVIASGVRRIAAASNDKQPSRVEIKIDNFSFSPATVTVPVGTTVRWTNRDDIPHTVVSEGEIFKSKPLDTDDQFTYTFTKPGTYAYFCSIHPRMTANIIVQ